MRGLCSELRTLLFAVLCLGSCSVIGQELVGCPTSRLHIITFNETLLPRSPDNIIPQIQFSSGPLVGTSFVNYGPNHTDVWCAPELETFPEPLVNLIFTEPVVVVGIISGGYTYETVDLDGLREYVSTFTLRHTLTGQDSGNDGFSLYTANLTGNGETEFVIDDDNVDQLVILKEPFSTLRVRLQVIERTRSPLINITCWSLAFLGCAASEAIYEDPSPTTEPPPIEVTVTTTDIISTTVYITPSSSCSPRVTVTATPLVETVTATVYVTPPTSNCTGSAVSQSSGAAASVAVPVALVTVVTVVIVVLVGVVVCVKRGRGKFTSDIRSSLDSSSPSDVHYVNAGTRGVHIADRRSTQDSRERAVTIKEVENELYKLNENRGEESAVYEDIPNSATPNAIKGNGNYVNSSPGAVAAAVDDLPPSYSALLAMSPPSLSSAAAAGPQTVPPNSLNSHDQNYSQIESDIYTVPFTPPNESTGRVNRNGFQLSRNESYGSLPNAPTPHYATPTSTLQYIPERHGNIQRHADSDEYEPMMLLPNAVTTDSKYSS